MKRDRFKDLREWRNDPYRKPLILRGCRQVGKSWLVREFGKEFESFVEINFEKNIILFAKIKNKTVESIKLIKKPKNENNKVLNERTIFHL